MIFEGEVFSTHKKSVAKKERNLNIFLSAYFCNKLMAHARPFRKLDSFAIEREKILAGLCNQVKKENLIESFLFAAIFEKGQTV